MYTPQRRQVLLGGLGVAAVGALGACGANTAGTGSVPLPTPSAPRGTAAVVKTLTAKQSTVDLGGPTVRTWTYDDVLPGPLLRAKAGDFVLVNLKNELPDDTTVHWHGIALSNAADGVPDMTQKPVGPGETYQYSFLVPDPGTYFFHPHVGLQLDRGLYAPLIVDDPAEPGGYDKEWVVVLDDWLDGTGTTPDQTLEGLVRDNATDSGDSGMGGMGGMHDMNGMGSMGTPPFGDGGDIKYPHFLINGRVPASPETFRAKPGQRVRIRFINAGSDTIFSVALGGHRMTITHTDGFPVKPLEVGAFYLAMGERYDVEVTLAEGVFPLTAVPFGKNGTPARALVRTGSGAVPAPTALPVELSQQIVMGADLEPTDASRLSNRSSDASIAMTLNGQMQPYLWGINGAPHGKNDPVMVSRGDRVRLRVANATMMTHPFHLHGHTFALATSGLRKDTVILRPMETRILEFQADNPGRWAAHCHNAYHAEAGMMAEMRYRG